MKKIIYILVLLISLVASGKLYYDNKRIKEKYTERCMKYMGYKGYPLDFYCKLFVEEIKARDEL